MILLFSFSLLKCQLIDWFVELHLVLFPACSIFVVSRGTFVVKRGVSSCGVWTPQLRAGLSCSLACGTLVKNPPALWETWVRSPGWEDRLEEGLEPAPVFLPGESPWTEEPGGLQSMGSQRVRHDWMTKHTQHMWDLSSRPGITPRSPALQVRFSTVGLPGMSSFY